MRSLSVKRVLSVVVPALVGLALFPSAASADAPATVLFNQFSQRCPDAASGYQDMHPCAPSDNPGMWVISRLAPNRYRITDVRDSGACLTSADAPVVQRCSLSDSRQDWDITRYEPEPGRYGLIGMRIKNANGWCLDNTEKTFGGWKITQGPCLDDTHQQWDIHRSTYEALWGRPLHTPA
ncbi:RICIN domain-containing protein [Kitasatospora sp. NPDC056446]|uniref:RICIN domain-containing protein n=1 Tax=Kitasatospora sp. NPDC056446 TaxID=3345819 RepID=UPI003678D754